MKKEIDVWVSQEWLDWALENEEDGPTISRGLGGANHKAKLIVEISEKRAEITESEFDEALSLARKQVAFSRSNYLIEKINAKVSDLRLKLFGED